MILLRLVTAKKGQAALDPDAQAFITAAGITDATQKSAINQLVLNLKSYSLWTKMKAIYPFVGGTATTHKYNLKNPADTNAAYRLTFIGSWTHNSSGAKNATGVDYADTHLLTNSLNVLNTSIGVYLGEEINDAGYQIGSINSFAGDKMIAIGIQKSSSRYVMAFSNASGQGLEVIGSQTVFKGFFNAVSRSTTDREYYRSATSLLTSTTNITPEFIANSCYLGALNTPNDTPGFGISSLFSFCYIANAGLSDAEVSNLYTTVQAYQTTLGRQV